MSNAHEGVLEYGKEIGIEAGKEIGIDIGMRNKSIEIVKKMIENGCSLDFITEMTD